jgi:NAD(P)-dependent dehydrogenase (short-subunit alcohol dehydrogenase family)
MYCYPDLKGKVVLITGWSRALGAEAAREFARSGARVELPLRDTALQAPSSMYAMAGEAVPFQFIEPVGIVERRCTAAEFQECESGEWH